ncbi:MAG: CDP-glucose 4,6-dehydratase [Myxococcota bacterium]
MASSLSAYRGKKVLLTGHTGFKGGWMALWLERLGAEVVGFATEAPSEPNLFAAASIGDHVRHVHGDIRDAAALDRVMAEHQPEIVFHMAAQPLVRLSYDEPDITFDTNVMGSLRVFEAIRRCDSVRVLINVTSDKCYENREWVWGYRESDAMGGYDPYSASKGCAELLFGAWYRSYFNPAKHGDTHHVAAASVRAGNVIGGGDWGRDRLIPDCFRALSKGEPIVIRSPKATRPWQHVLEPLSGYLEVGARLMSEPVRYGGGWNFGPLAGDDWNVEAIVKEVCGQWGDGEYRVDGGQHPHEAHWLKLDCAKANIELSWLPRWNVRRALKETTRWYRAYHDGADAARMTAFTLEQIEAYESTTPGYGRAETTAGEAPP